MSTVAETHAYSAMQARLVSLLLRFDEAGFSRYYRAHPHAASDDALRLRPYRDLAAVFVLRDELFVDILPRIVRRLSFAAPRNLVIEAPPTQGRIDWERSLAATWNECPGEAPLLLHTRQRRRNFATAENLLTVVTLLAYQGEVQRLLWDEHLVAGNTALRHPLNELSARCERELAFPQFAGLRSSAQAILDGAHGGPSALEQQVYERLMPGSNSAYEDLLAWRARLHALPLLRRDSRAQHAALGADPARDNYLYQLWIFYELADLLRDLGCLETLDVRQGQMALRFHWATCRYELRHDQSVPLPPGSWRATALGDAPNAAPAASIPGVRPDFYLWRIEPPSVQVAHAGHLIWREPGVIWDAKYYREQERSSAPSSPVKRMLADLNLLGECYGTLLFALLNGASAAQPEAAYGYRLNPASHNQRSIPDQQITIQPLCPELAPERVRATLQHLLDQAHALLAQVRRPRCHGVFLDSLSLSAQPNLCDRAGQALPSSDLLVCPKPHIGPWRIDLVSRNQHCCQDATLCHIINQAEATIPVRPPRTAQELISELERLTLHGDPEQFDEASVTHVITRIEALTRRFAEVSGALHDMGRYEAKLGDIGLDATLHLIGPDERISLALAIYLRDQLDDIHANDYSAPLIHLARVLERELQRRIMALPEISGSDFPHGKPTLGSMGGIYRKNPELWQRIMAQLTPRWQAHIDAEDPHFSVSIEQFINELTHLVRARNQAAHTTPIARNRFRTILRTLCDGGPLRIGSLNVLLLAWPTTIEPTAPSP